LLSRRTTSVRVSAPCRADLAGGTLDIWPLGLLHHGAVTVNMAIPVEVVLVVSLGGSPGVVEHTIPDGGCRSLCPEDASTDLAAAVGFALSPEGGVRVKTESQAPYRSGIGGSSSFGVAMASALSDLLGETRSEEELVALIRDLEARVLGVPTGEQDHWAAVRGGVLALHLDPGGPRLEAIEVSPGWLDQRITVFFSGIRHRSGMVNWQVVRRRLDGDRRTTDAFEEIAAAAQACRLALVDGDEHAVAAAIDREWAARRQLAPEVNPPELDALVGVARANGAAAVKACGAGGGGSLLVWHSPGAGDGVAAALEAAAENGRVLASGPSDRGLILSPES
jgi:D-glycero-alpha-D-manno-heptose-7-phosphate kinase